MSRVTGILSDMRHSMSGRHITIRRPVQRANLAESTGQQRAVAAFRDPAAGPEFRPANAGLSPGKRPARAATQVCARVSDRRSAVWNIGQNNAHRPDTAP